jgi:hypothetical protein
VYLHRTLPITAAKIETFQYFEVGVDVDAVRVFRGLGIVQRRDPSVSVEVLTA